MKLQNVTVSMKEFFFLKKRFSMLVLLIIIITVFHIFDIFIF